MALSYELEMAADLDSQQALQIVANTCLLQWQGEQLIGNGIQVRAFKESEEDNQELTKQAFGFSPTLIVNFRIKSGQHSEQAERIMIRATAALLQATSKDAVLLFNYENIVLQRIHNQLIINQDLWDAWKADELKKIGMPHTIAVLSSPLL
ncbi:MAG: hypothetical protein KME47_25850 [Nodosilinea sp. WJT8-NPBG4]|jgi:uncharacterized protein VirK/YbjX|nr:hypothetical protein [Nodosilinea sp. WJT8-NPBG4]